MQLSVNSRIINKNKNKKFSGSSTRATVVKYRIPAARAQVVNYEGEKRVASLRRRVTARVLSGETAREREKEIDMEREKGRGEK